MGNLRAAKKDAIRALNAKRRERAAARKAVWERKKMTKKAKHVEDKGEQLRKGVVFRGPYKGRRVEMKGRPGGIHWFVAQSAEAIVQCDVKDVAFSATREEPKIPEAPPKKASAARINDPTKLPILCFRRDAEGGASSDGIARARYEYHKSSNELLVRNRAGPSRAAY